VIESIYYPGTCIQRLRTTMKKSQDSRCPGRDSNPSPSEYKSATLQLQQRARSGGRAIAQAVSRRLPTAATRFRAQVRSCEICDEQSGTAAGFLRVLQFPLPSLIPPTALHSSSSVIRGWYNRPVSGRRTKWTQSHPTTRN
jgi:hypothetical protein